MEKLEVTIKTTIQDVRKFCGDKVLIFTGETKVITPTGSKRIDVGSIIIKNSDSSFEVENEFIPTPFTPFKG